MEWLGADGPGVSLPGGGVSLAVEDETGNLRHPSVRVLTFLAGLPDLGEGALSGERRGLLPGARTNSFLDNSFFRPPPPSPKTLIS